MPTIVVMITKLCDLIIVPGNVPNFIGRYDQSSQNVNFTWTPPIEPNGIIIGYYLSVWTENMVREYNFSNGTENFYWNASILCQNYMASIQAKTRLGKGNTTITEFKTSPGRMDVREYYFKT